MKKVMMTMIMLIIALGVAFAVATTTTLDIKYIVADQFSSSVGFKIGTVDYQDSAIQLGSNAGYITADSTTIHVYDRSYSNCTTAGTNVTYVKFTMPSCWKDANGNDTSSVFTVGALTKASSAESDGLAVVTVDDADKEITCSYVAGIADRTGSNAKELASFSLSWNTAAVVAGECTASIAVSYTAI